MAYITRDLTQMFLTSAGSTRTNLVGHLDDANNVMVFITSSCGVLSSNCSPIVSWWDPEDPLPSTVTTSMFYKDLLVGTSFAFSSGTTVINFGNISFRGLGLQTSANALTTGDLIAYVTKQITV